MAETKIRGHRIADGAIDVRHVSSDFKLEESQLNLAHGTHDNAGDITVPQKNVLTQMGNADSLHYHTGGGGGPNGIYTNEQRDVQLLKLSMLYNSTRWGLDKSVRDGFEDDKSIYYGIKSPQPPDVETLKDDPAIGGTLPSNRHFEYGIAYKTIYGETNIISTAGITTKDGAYNANRIIFGTVPAENKGFKIFRSTSNLEKVILDTEDISDWNNPMNLPMDLVASDKTSGTACIRVALNSGSDEKGVAAHVTRDIAEGIGKRVMKESEPVKVVVQKNVPFQFIFQIHNKGKVDKLELLWDTNPGLIPIDYEVYYTTDSVPEAYGKTEWVKFKQLNVPRVANGSRALEASDGTALSDYKIVGNSRWQNMWIFRPIMGVTGIKIIVTKVDSRCQLNDIKLKTVISSAGSVLTHNLDQKTDLSEFRTLKFDAKAGHDQSVLYAGFESKSGIDVTTVNKNPIAGVGVTPSHTLPRIINQTVRTRLAYSSFNLSKFNRIRFMLQPKANTNVHAEGFYLMIDGKNNINSTNARIIDDTSVLVPVTFSGSHTLKIDNAPAAPIWSDWINVEFPNKTILGLALSFRAIDVDLYAWNNVYPDTVAVVQDGVQAEFNWTQYPQVLSHYDYSLIVGCETGISFGQSKTDEINPVVSNEWHRHYIQIPTTMDYKDVDQLMVSFTNVAADQDMYLDNFVATRSESLMMKKKPGNPEVDLVWTDILTSPVADNFENLRLLDFSPCKFTMTPTQRSPVRLMYDYGSPQASNQLLLLFGERNTAAKTYAIQYTTDSSAKAEDEFANPKWQLLKSLTIGEPGIIQKFKGSIVEGIVYENNMWGGFISHRYEPIIFKKIRVVAFSTIGDTPLEIRSCKVMSNDDNGEMKLIYESNSPAFEGQKIIDDGRPTIQESPKEFNTTGSYNIIYDEDRHFVERKDKTKAAAMFTKAIPIGLFTHILLTAQTVGTVVFNASIDGGQTFHKVTPETLHSYNTQSESMILKVELNSEDASIHAFALLYTV